MHILKQVLAASALFLSIASTAQAGPNAGGTLIVHAAPSITYCQDQSTYCGSQGIESCEQAIVSVSGTQTYVFFALAAFCPPMSPRLSGITFGVEYDATLVASGACGDFELATDSWPASGSGTAITWNAPKTAFLTPVYWFAGYNYYSPTPAHFAMTPHPTQGGMFADDSVPALLDPIAAYGKLGFDQPGLAPCADCAHPMGACCFGCECIVLSADDCTAQGGVYFGDGTNCDPNPCDCPPPVGACCIGCECIVTDASQCASQGGIYFGDFTDCSQPICGEGPPIACCLSDGSCIVTTPCGCTQIGGVWDGESTSCEPNPCIPIATEPSSWGRVKSHYR